METVRRWSCTCTGQPVELEVESPDELEEGAEPVCWRCGASPSSDPKRTIRFREYDPLGE